MERLIVEIISLDHIGTVFIIFNNNFNEISLNEVCTQNCSFQYSLPGSLFTDEECDCFPYAVLICTVFSEFFCPRPLL